MHTWAFIFKSKDCSPERHCTELPHNGSRLLIYGVSTIEDGVEVAKRLVEEEGAILIELCGGFGPEGAQKVIEAVEDKALVGYIDYFPGHAESFAHLFN